MVTAQRTHLGIQHRPVLCTCAYVCAHVCVRVSVCVCARPYVYVFARVCTCVRLREVIHPHRRHALFTHAEGLRSLVYHQTGAPREHPHN